MTRKFLRSPYFTRLLPLVLMPTEVVQTYSNPHLASGAVILGKRAKSWDMSGPQKIPNRLQPCIVNTRFLNPHALRRMHSTHKVCRTSTETIAVVEDPTTALIVILPPLCDSVIDQARDVTAQTSPSSITSSHSGVQNSIDYVSSGPF